ncbi:MAG: Ig-like domain-containing protein [Leptospirales bacterium]|nr:Ig-like domain-containing protein [Leptospirales bacterium]
MRIQWCLFCFLVLWGCKEVDKNLSKFLLPGGGETTHVISTYPQDHAIGVSASDEYWVLFSSEMDQQKTQDSLSILSSSGRIDGSFRWDGNRLIFKPRSPLNGTGEYTMTVGSKSETKFGADLGRDTVIRFYTTNDLTHPALVSSTPTNGATGVNPIAPITLQFSKPISFATVGSGISISPSFVYTSSQSPDLTQVILTPAAALAPGAYTVTIKTSLEDTSGNALLAGQTVFFVVGTSFIPPAILSVTSGAVTLQNGLLTTGVDRQNSVVIVFSAPMNRLTVENALTFSPFVASNKVWNLGSTQLTLQFTPGLDAQSLYTLSMATSAADTNGNFLTVSGSFPFYTDGPLSQRPRILDIRQMRSSAPSAACTDNAVTGPAFATGLVDFSPLDTIQLIDLNAGAAAFDCVLQTRITFNNNMVRSSLVSSTSFTPIINPSAASVTIHDIQLAGNVMTLLLKGSFPAHTPSQVPVFRLRIASGSGGALDTNGNSMQNDYELYLSY